MHAMKSGGFSLKSKKTPFQRHKELEEEKKRVSARCACCTAQRMDRMGSHEHTWPCMGAQKAEEEAAKVYEEFVESFGVDEGGKDGPGVKTFVRGGTVTPG